MTYYFDRETGRRVSKSTWTRSKAQGGTRYCRRSVSPSPSSSKRKQKASHARVRKVRKTTAKKPAKKPTKKSATKQHPKKGGTGRTMYRLTVAAPFSVRTGKKKNDYASAAAMFRAWYRRYPSEEKIDDAIEAARDLRDQEVNNNKKYWHHDEEPNVEVKKVPYDPDFIDTTEETTDLP